MNLSESPRCIMMKLHPLVARRLANKLRSQFKLSNCRFLNVEAQRELTTPPRLGIAPVVQYSVQHIHSVVYAYCTYKINASLSQLDIM